MGHVRGEGAVAPPRLPYWAALDGLRGLALLAMLLYHHDAPAMRGGYFSVSVFFTLSGFLIMSLVLAEHERTGRVDLRRFWSRRARRLLPAALLGVAFAVLASSAVLPAEERHRVIGHGIAALANVANWWSVAEGLTYNAIFGAPDALEHFWSLAIEEQFYLFFPLVAVFALRWGRSGLVTAIAALTAASLTVGFLLDSPNREYLGTDTRAVEILVGCLLALAMHRRAIVAAGATRVARVVADVVGVAALATIGVLWARIPLGEPALYRGGFAAFSLVSAAAVFACVRGSLVPAVLGARPLAWLGRVSYGVYVFHLPMYLLLTEDRTGLDGAGLFALRVAATVAVAAVSFSVIESPIRFGARMPALRARASYVVAVACVGLLVAGVNAAGELTIRERAGALTVAAGTGAPPPPPSVVAPATVPAGSVAGPTTETTSGDGATPAAPDVAGPGTTSGAVAVPSTSSPAGARRQAGEPAATGTSAPAATVPASVPAVVPRILVVGDSTGKANGKGIERWAAKTGGAVVRTASFDGANILEPDAVRIRDGWVDEDPYRGLLDQVRGAARDFQPDMIVVFVGSGQLSDQRLFDDDQWRSFGDAFYETKYREALAEAVRRWNGLGVPILWNTVAVPDWDPNQQFAWPGSGHVTMNDPVRTKRLNEQTTAYLAGHANVAQFPWAERLASNGGLGRDARPDGLHHDPAVIERMMGTWLGADLRAAYQTVRARPAARLTAPRVTTWD